MAPHDVPGGIRALGWDVQIALIRSTAARRSHDARSGTAASREPSLWLDPRTDLFVLFLSNRVHPTATEPSTRSPVGSVPSRDSLLRASAPRRKPPEPGAEVGHRRPARRQFRRAARRARGARHQRERRALATERARSICCARRRASSSSRSSPPSTAFRSTSTRRSPTASTSARACPSTASTATSSRRPTRCSRASTRWCSTSRTPARASSPTPRRCTARSRSPPSDSCGCWSSIAPIRSDGIDVAGPVLERRRALVREPSSAARSPRHDVRRARRDDRRRRAPRRRARSRAHARAGSAAQYFDQTGLRGRPVAQPALGRPRPCSIPASRWSRGPTSRWGEAPTRRSRFVGAPWIDERLVAALRERRARGVGFRQAKFTPTSSIYAGAECTGVASRSPIGPRSSRCAPASPSPARLRDLYPDAWHADKLDQIIGNKPVTEAILDRRPLGRYRIALERRPRSFPRQAQEVPACIRRRNGRSSVRFPPLPATRWPRLPRAAPYSKNRLSFEEALLEAEPAEEREPDRKGGGGARRKRRARACASRRARLEAAAAIGRARKTGRNM